MLPEDDAVPNDIALGERHTVLVISGPNGGGKTVAMKAVGLAAVMIRLGLHVPAADGARVDLFDQILVNIGDGQDMRESLSTFSAHMFELSGIVAAASQHTLALLDEVGVGTDPSEGAALAQSILETLATRGARVIATTHYNLLKEMAEVDDRFCNASVEFDPITLAPTFRLHTGTAGEIPDRATVPRYLDLVLAATGPERPRGHAGENLCEGGGGGSCDLTTTRHLPNGRRNFDGR